MWSRTVHHLRPIHSPTLQIRLICGVAGGSWTLSQLSSDERRGTPLTSHHLQPLGIIQPKGRVSDQRSHLRRLTVMGNLWEEQALLRLMPPSRTIIPTSWTARWISLKLWLWEGKHNLPPLSNPGRFQGVNKLSDALIYENTPIHFCVTVLSLNSCEKSFGSKSSYCIWPQLFFPLSYLPNLV